MASFFFSFPPFSSFLSFRLSLGGFRGKQLLNGHGSSETRHWEAQRGYSGEGLSALVRPHAHARAMRNKQTWCVPGPGEAWINPEIYAEKQQRCILLFIYFAGGLINSPDLLTVVWPQDVWSEINERTTVKSSGGGGVVFFWGGKADLKKPKERIEDGF